MGNKTKTLDELVCVAVDNCYDSETTIKLRRERDNAEILVSKSEHEYQVLVSYSLVPYVLVSLSCMAETCDVANELIRFGINPNERGWKYDLEDNKQQYKELKTKAIGIRAAIKNLEGFEANDDEEDDGTDIPSISIYQFAEKYNIDPMDVVRWLMHLGVFEQVFQKDMMLCPHTVYLLERDHNLRELPTNDTETG